MLITGVVLVPPGLTRAGQRAMSGTLRYDTVTLLSDHGTADGSVRRYMGSMIMTNAQ